MNEKRCHDCNAKEGDLHDFGCDMERCPFCGGQLISCDCCYKFLDLFDTTQYDGSTAFLPPEIYHNGLNDEQEKRWEQMLEARGRFPYIVYPNICQKCGKLWPEMFMVPDLEWKRYIQPDMRRAVICRTCYDDIKRVTDAASKG